MPNPSRAWRRRTGREPERRKDFIGRVITDSQQEGDAVYDLLQTHRNAECLRSNRSRSILNYRVSYELMYR